MGSITPSSGGSVISDADDQIYDFGRLEDAVQTLVEKYRSLQGSSASLRAQLRERDARVRDLEGQLREANQLRQDAGKRIDDLIAQMEQLDAHFGADVAE